MSGWSELFRGKASVYALDEVSKEWVDRGISGALIMYLNNQFRSDVRIKWAKNSKEIWWRLINGKLKPKGERAWVLKAWDTASNRQEILAVRFSDIVLSQSFAQKFHAVFPQQQQNQNNNNQQQNNNNNNQQQHNMQQQYNNNRQQYNNNFNNQQQAHNYNNRGMPPPNPMQMRQHQQSHQQHGNQQNIHNKINNGKSWECAVCTYSNDISKPSCVMCGLSADATKEANNNINFDQQQQNAQMIPPSPSMQSIMMNSGSFRNINNNMGGNRGNNNNHQSTFSFNDQQQNRNASMSLYAQQSQQKILSSYQQHQNNASAVTSPHSNQHQPLTWICPMCTLNNSPTVTRCVACHAKRSKVNGNGGVVPIQMSNKARFNQRNNNNNNNNPLLMGGNNNMNNNYNPMMNNMQYMNGAMNQMMNMGMMMNNNHMNNQQYNGGNNQYGGGMGGLPPPNADMSGAGGNKKKIPTVGDFQQAASDIACYNDNPSSVFSTLRSVAKKLLKDDVRYRTLDTTNPKVMERLIGFEGVLDFLMLLGFEADAMGMKLICNEKPTQNTVRNAIEVLNTYESRLGIGRKHKKKDNGKDDDQQSFVTLGGPNDKSSDNNKKEEEDTLTLEQIIIWSTHEAMRDNDTMETLILTHKQFSDSLSLIKNLRRRFFVPIPNDIRDNENKIKEFRINVQKRIQLKVIKSLRDWMKTYWDEDFKQDKDVQNELLLWLKELDQHSSDCTWIGPLSKTVSKEFQRFKLKGSTKTKLDPLPTFDSVKIPKKNTINSLSSKDLADQITLMDYRIFSRIQERECIGQSWKKKQSASLAPNILAMIRQFNNLTVFVQIQILREKTLKERGKAISRLIKMGERFRELKNYNSLCAVVGALNSSPIHRLKLSWKRVPEKQVNLFEQFKSIFARDFNSRNFRQIFRNISPPAIPYFGLFLQDLVFIDDGNDQFKQIDNFVQHGAMVNFNKCVRTTDRIKNIRLYQKTSYIKNIKQQDVVQKILLLEFDKLKNMTEDQIWDMSTEVKKQDEKDSKKKF